MKSGNYWVVFHGFLAVGIRNPRRPTVRAWHRMVVVAVATALAGCSIQRQASAEDLLDTVAGTFAAVQAGDQTELNRLTVRDKELVRRQGQDVRFAAHVDTGADVPTASDATEFVALNDLPSMSAVIARAGASAD